MSAILVLEDGTIFKGQAFGARGEKCGEVVFNTSMSGYQEILTDPSYNEQIVTMTYPLIGNYGTNGQDVEARKAFVRGFVVKENCDYPSNWRSGQTLDGFLKKQRVVGISGIDTRMLVKRIREKGAMNGIISSSGKSIGVLKSKLKTYPGLVGRDIVRQVTSAKPYPWKKGVVDLFKNGKGKPKKRFKVVAFDFGIKQNILRLLVSHGCQVSVVPASTPAEKVLAQNPQGIFLSNGPGDPQPVSYAVKTVQSLLGRVPIFGICLGHQILSLALGAKTYKLKFGHRGANHPVRREKTGDVEITSQNHGFSVDPDSLSKKQVTFTHWNLNDQTLEGIQSKKYPAFSVQYHPEASPGPHDSAYLFQEFTALMKNKKAFAR